MSSTLLLGLAAWVAQNLTPSPGTSNIGYLIIAIILSPAVILILAALLGKPREPRIVVIFLVLLFGMYAVFITVTYLLGLVTGIFF
jgi:hypothetical protein